MKKFYLFLIFYACVFSLHAQNEFILQRDSTEYGYTDGNAQTSAIIVECYITDKPLVLYSELLGEHEIKYSEKHGNYVEYIFEISVPGTKWEQDINFQLEGYNTKKARVTFDAGKQAILFTVTDPNKATSGYYYHRKEAKGYLDKGNYELAMAEYKRAESQSNVDKEEIKLLMAEVAKIQGLYAAAKDSADIEKYYAAGEIYKQIKELNYFDKKADTLLRVMDAKFNEHTNTLLNEGKRYYNQHKYKEAQEYFQNYLNFHGTNLYDAQKGVSDCKIKIQNKRVMPHVLYYQFDKKAPINFGYGRFTNRKVGWFMNLSMNTELFNLIDGNWDPKNEKGDNIPVYEKVIVENEITNGVTPSKVREQTDNIPEISLAIVGLSIPLVSPQPEKDNNYFKLVGLTIPKFPALYLNIVPLSASLSFGYEGTNYYRKKEGAEEKERLNSLTEYYENQKEGYLYTKEHKTTPLFNYAPQVGLTLKWGRLALFYTFEYRYLVNERDNFKDNIRANRNMFGIGFAW